MVFVLLLGLLLATPSFAQTAETYRQRAVAFSRNKSWDEAVASYQKALELEPNDALTHYNLALAFKYKGDATRVFEEEDASEISDRLIHVERFDEPCILLTVVADSVSEAREINRVIRTLPWVTSSHLYFQQGLVQIRKPLSIAGRASSRRKIPLAAALDFEGESKVRS